MHERLVVAVLVGAGELQVAVEEQPDVGRPAARGQRLGQHDLLVGRALRHDDRGVVERLAGRDEELPGGGGREPERARHRDGARDDRPAGPARQGGAQQHDDADRRQQVDRRHDDRAADLAEDRQQQEREGQAAGERPDVVHGEQVRRRLARVLRPDPLQQRHQQRHLGADQAADDDRRRDQRRGVEVEPGVGGVQPEDRQPAGQREGQLDGGETGRGAGQQRLARERPETHRADEHPQHDGGLVDRAADEVLPEGDQRQLVDQPAGRAQEHRRQQQDPGGAAADRQDERVLCREQRRRGDRERHEIAAASTAPRAIWKAAVTKTAGVPSGSVQIAPRSPGVSRSSTLNAAASRMIPSRP